MRYDFFHFLPGDLDSWMFGFGAAMELRNSQDFCSPTFPAANDSWNDVLCLYVETDGSM